MIRMKIIRWKVMGSSAVRHVASTVANVTLSHASPICIVRAEAEWPLPGHPCTWFMRPSQRWASSLAEASPHHHWSSTQFLSGSQVILADQLWPTVKVFWRISEEWLKVTQQLCERYTCLSSLLRLQRSLFPRPTGWLWSSTPCSVSAAATTRLQDRCSSGSYM